MSDARRPYIAPSMLERWQVTGLLTTVILLAEIVAASAVVLMLLRNF